MDGDCPELHTRVPQCPRCSSYNVRTVATRWRVSAAGPQKYRHTQCLEPDCLATFKVVILNAPPPPDFQFVETSGDDGQ